MLMLDEHVLLPYGIVLQAIVPEEHPYSLLFKERGNVWLLYSNGRVSCRFCVKTVSWLGQAQPLLYRPSPANTPMYSSGWACPSHDTKTLLMKKGTYPYC